MTRPHSNAADVRMHGFRDRVRVEDALDWVDGQSQPVGTESVDVSEAFRRVLAVDVTAEQDVPPFDRSAMDGYAVRGAETVGASDYHCVSFRLLGDSMPGRPFEGTVSAGCAVRIMTGAPVPAGADAVVPAEYARAEAATVEITTSIPPGKHVGHRAEDVRMGAIVLRCGRVLRPQDLGLLASVGCRQVAVREQPRVRVVLTGNELVAPGARRGPYQIYDANGSMLPALVRRDGGRVESLTHVPDDRDAVRRAMTQPADVVLVSGGSSVGAEDHAPGVLAEEGELAIHGIAMRPSSPTGMGRIGQTLVFLLPGNPVSCLCAYDFFAGRAIRLCAALGAGWPYRRAQARVQTKIVSAIGRVDYCRVQVERLEDSGDSTTASVGVDRFDTTSIHPNSYAIKPVAIGGASILSSTTRADGFVIVPAGREGYPPGATVTMFFYDASIL